MIFGRRDKLTCSPRCRVTRSRRLQPAPLNTEVTVVGDGTGTALPPVKEREWAWVHSPSERDSAFTRVRHILVESDPYSGFGKTACGRESRQPWGDALESDVYAAEARDGIPPNFCRKCDRLTR